MANRSKTFRKGEPMRNDRCASLWIVAALLAWAGGGTAQAKDSEVRKLDVSAVTTPPNKWRAWAELNEAPVITSAKNLEFADKASQAAISKQVDFSKEKLIFFVWKGSRYDKLIPKATKSKEGRDVVEFHFVESPTDEARMYMNFYIFAIPRGASWKQFGEIRY
jgi:hypothetical protein